MYTCDRISRNKKKHLFKMCSELNDTTDTWSRQECCRNAAKQRVGFIETNLSMRDIKVENILIHSTKIMK